MKYDLRTCDSAYDFILDFMNMTSKEYLDELLIGCKNDFDIFWKRNYDRIAEVDISELQIMAFHIIGVLDDCKEIQKKGLMNLQEVLSNDTILNRQLNGVGIKFNIQEKTVNCNGKVYDIDYEQYCGRSSLSETEEKLKDIVYRVYYDFCVNGFLLNDNVFDYGTDIHERPEFLMTLGHLFSEAKKLDSVWRSKSKSYKIDFYATIDQIRRFSFELDEFKDEGQLELDDEMKIKKWMLSYAIDRAAKKLDTQFLYVKDDVIISPEQIIEISELYSYKNNPINRQG